MYTGVIWKHGLTFWNQVCLNSYLYIVQMYSSGRQTAGYCEKAPITSNFHESLTLNIQCNPILNFYQNY